MKKNSSGSASITVTHTDTNKYDDISNYRLDRITDLKILDEPAKPFEKLSWANGRSLDLAAYMQEHPYMYASENIRVTFRIVRPMISDVLDMFGSDVRFLDEDETGVTVSALTNKLAMVQFAKNFAPDVIVMLFGSPSENGACTTAIAHRIGHRLPNTL